MAEFFNNLPDGWTIYIWMIAAAMILIAAAFFLRWASKNFQFDEDIKYVVFDETDKDKMSPEEYEKSREVIKAQVELRDEVKRKRAEMKQQRSNK